MATEQVQKEQVASHEPPQERGLQSAGTRVGQGPSLRAKARAPQRFMGIEQVQNDPDASPGPGAVRSSDASPPAGGEPAVLVDAAMAARLCSLALEVERRLGTPQDVEWAALNGTIHVLQARPITTDLGNATSSPPEVWCNANVCENLPGVLTPMSWSLVELLLVGCFRRIMALIGVDTDLRPWFGRIAGRAYLNVGVSDELLRRVQFFPEVDIWSLLGGKPGPVEQAALKAARRPVRLSARHLLWLGWLGLRVAPYLGERGGAGFIRTVRKRVEGLCQTDLTALPDAELASFIPASITRVFPEVDHPAELVRVFAGLSPGLACAVLLRVACRRWLGDPEGGIARGLLGGAGDMDSAAAALDLWRLAAAARAVPELSSVLLTAADFAQARDQIRATPAGAAFLDQWDEFLRRHGHHARGEVDVFSPRWAETPDFVLEMLRQYLRLPDGFDPGEDLARRQQERDRLGVETRKRLRNPIKRWFVSYLVRRAQRGLAYRENIKTQAVRCIAIMRNALLESGRRLTTRGILKEVPELFFLTIEELGQALRGQPPIRVDEIVAQRRLERERLQQLDPPSIVVGDYQPQPPETQPQPSGDRLALRGLGVSAGVARGPARVVAADDHTARVLPGEILVAPWTDPGWTPLFLPAAAIVTDIGGELSHGSIIAREYGIPAVVNVGEGTRRIRTGQILEVDGTRGWVTVFAQLEPTDVSAAPEIAGDP